MLVYLCAGLNEAEVNDSAPCSGDIGSSIIGCIGGELIAGWAVGGGVSIVDCLFTPAFYREALLDPQ